MRRSLTAATAALLLVAGCGGSDGGGSGPVDTTSIPACADLWKPGAAVPDDYDGCTDDAGDVVAGVSYDCGDGSRMWVYEGPDGAAWWTAGGKVTTGGERAYGRAFDACNRD